MAEKKPLHRRPGHSLLLVRLIAIDKFVKAAFLLVVGVYILHMIKLDKNVHDTLVSLLHDVRIDEDNRFVRGLLARTLGINDRTLRLFYAGTLTYAALYLIEGLGLFFDRPWAEWLTIISTALFLPVEIHEIIKELTLLRVVIFLLNVLMVIYLALRLHWRHEAKKAGVDLKSRRKRQGKIIG